MNAIRELNILQTRFKILQDTGIGTHLFDKELREKFITDL